MLKKKGGDHPWDDLAKSGYKPDMKYKSLTYFYIFGYILKMKYRNLAIFTIFFSLLAVQTLMKNHFIFEYMKFFWATFHKKLC